VAATAAPDSLTTADRQLVVDVALDDHSAGVLAQAILEQPTRRAAIAYVRAALERGVTSGWTLAGEAFAIRGLGQRAGLAVTVGERSGLLRWQRSPTRSATSSSCSTRLIRS
jgi:GAF domain-containing protein